MKVFYYNKARNHTKADTDSLIKSALCEYFGKQVCARVKRTEKGKPYLDDCPLHIGVTHTDDTVLIAINDKPFGIDCESKERTVKNASRIADKYFCDNEKSYVFEKSSDEKETDMRFLEIWVKKEAYVKFTGEGLSGMSGCDVTSICGFKLVENKNNLLIYIYEEE